jgi:hypothetical protein
MFMSVSFPVTRLKNLGILTDDGSVVGFTLNKQESLSVIMRLREVLKTFTAEDYLRGQPFTSIFPDCIVYQIIRDNKGALK